MLVPHGTLVVIVDGHHMKLLRNCGKEATPRLEILSEHTQKNPRGHVLATDGPGHAFESATTARHTYAHVDHHQQREDRFAKKALTLLENTKSSAPVILIAPPHILGELRAERDDVLKKRTIAEIDKDLTHLGADDLTRFLHSYQPA